MTTAFQSSAFQDSAFQIDAVTQPGTATGGGFIPFQRKRKRKNPRPIEELVEAAIEVLPNPTPTQVAKKVIPQVRQYYVLDNRREIAALRAEITRLVLAIQEENDNEDEAAFLLLAA